MSAFRRGLSASATLLGMSLLTSSPVAAQSANERPASVVVVMSTSRNYNGTYRLKEIARDKLLKPGGMVIGQHHAKEPPVDLPEWDMFRQESYGDTKLSFFRQR